MSKKDLDSVYTRILDFQPRKADVKKIRIINAVIDCLVKYGLDGTTFQRVGERLKMGRSLVAYYLPDRDAMVQAAIRYVVAVGQQFTVEFVDQAKNEKEALNAVAEGAFRWLEKYPKYLTVQLLFYYLASYDKKYQKMHTGIRQVGEDRIYALLKAYRESDSQKLRKLAKDIHGLITGNIIGWATTNTPLSLSDVRARTVETILRLARES